MTLEEIKNKALDDNFIVETKKKLKEKFQTESEVYAIGNDILIYSERVLVPLSQQKRMKSLMRSYVYWCSMDRNIESLIKPCKGCALAGKAPTINSTHGQKLTTHGWSRLHFDFAGHSMVHIIWSL